MKNIYMRFPEGRTRALTLSYDDGVEQDVRLIDIMKANGLKGTFNINSGLFRQPGVVFTGVHRRMSEEECVKLYKDSGMEVACHALTHPSLPELMPMAAIDEVYEDRKNLEKLFGRNIRGMAYPFGTYNDEVVRILRDCGIVYSRTVVSTRRFGIPENWLLLDPTCHHNDPELETLTERFLTRKVTEGPQMFYLWGHAYEFEEYDNWEVIEGFAEKVKNVPDIWYATNIEIYDYVHAFRELRFSADGSLVYNPTVTPVWIARDGRITVAESGKETEI